MAARPARAEQDFGEATVTGKGLITAPNALRSAPGVASKADFSCCLIAGVNAALGCASTSRLDSAAPDHSAFFLAP
jgi:hypothetical protein